MTEFTWTPDLEEEICADISSGASMRSICSREGMPSEATLYRRMAIDDAFATKIATARAAQQDHEVEECVRIADDATPEDVHVAKLRISTRQWRAAKLNPKKYGDRQAVELSGAIDVSGAKDRLSTILTKIAPIAADPE